MIYGGVPLYRRSSMIKNIRVELEEEYGIKLTSDVIKKVLELEEAEVMLGISRNMQMCFVWGTLYGVDQPPTRLRGTSVDSKSVEKYHGFSMWKTGVPKFKGSKIAGMTDCRMPQEYFDMPEHKYTTNARMFRKNAGMPEIDEYKDLPEEKIQELCKKADDIELQNLTKAQQKRRLERKKAEKVTNDVRHMLWDDTGYVPYGAYAENFEGKQRSVIDQLYDINYNEADTPDIRLEVIRRIIDVASQREVTEDYPQLFALELQLEEECKNAGLPELPHYDRVEDYHVGKMQFYRNGRRLGTEKVADLIREYETAAWVQRGERRNEAREEFRKQFIKDKEENGVQFNEQVKKYEHLGLADKEKGEKVRIVEENLTDAISGLKCVDKDKGWKDTWILERPDGTTSQNQERRSDLVMWNGDIYTKNGDIIVSEENMKKRKENMSKLGTQVKKGTMTNEEYKELCDKLNAQKKCWDDYEYKRLYYPNIEKQTSYGNIVGNNWKDGGELTDFEKAAYAARAKTDVEYKEWVEEQERLKKEAEEQEERDLEELKRLESVDEFGGNDEFEDVDEDDWDGEDDADEDGEDDKGMSRDRERLKLREQARKQKVHEAYQNSKKSKYGDSEGSYDIWVDGIGYLEAVDVDDDGHYIVVDKDTGELLKVNKDGTLFKENTANTENTKIVKNIRDLEDDINTDTNTNVPKKWRSKRYRGLEGGEKGIRELSKIRGLNTDKKPNKGQVSGVDNLGAAYVSNGVYGSAEEEMMDRFEINGEWDKYGNYVKKKVGDKRKSHHLLKAEEEEEFNRTFNQLMEKRRSMKKDAQEERDKMETERVDQADDFDYTEEEFEQAQAMSV